MFLSYRERGESVAHLELKETEYVAVFFLLCELFKFSFYLDHLIKK